MILGVFLGLFGELYGSLFCARNGRFWVVEGQVEGQTGGTFSEKWRDKSGVKRIPIAEVGKLPLFPLYL
jgi:hypothetical protein